MVILHGETRVSSNLRNYPQNFQNNCADKYHNPGSRNSIIRTRSLELHEERIGGGQLALEVLHLLLEVLLGRLSRVRRRRLAAVSPAASLPCLLGWSESVQHFSSKYEKQTRSYMSEHCSIRSLGRQQLLTSPEWMSPAIVCLVLLLHTLLYSDGCIQMWCLNKQLRLTQQIKPLIRNSLSTKVPRLTNNVYIYIYIYNRAILDSLRECMQSNLIGRLCLSSNRVHKRAEIQEIGDHTGVCKINACSKSARYDSQTPLPPDDMNSGSGSACKINTRFRKIISALSFQL